MKAVVFDFDNTLERWRSFEDEAEFHLAGEIAEQFGLDAAAFKEEFDRIKVGYLLSTSLPQDYGRDVWFAETFAHFGLFDMDVAPFVEHYWNILIPLVELFPGTIQTLEFLKEEGFLIGMLTDQDGSTREYKQRRLDKLGITAYFDAILSSEELGVNKPNPRLFQEIARRLRVRCDECMMVGDNPPKDLITAKELGFVTVWQKEDVARPEESFSYVDYEVSRIQEVCDLVKKTSAQ